MNNELKFIPMRIHTLDLESLHIGWDAQMQCFFLTTKHDKVFLDKVTMNQIELYIQQVNQIRGSK